MTRPRGLRHLWRLGDPPNGWPYTGRLFKCPCGAWSRSTESAGGGIGRELYSYDFGNTWHKEVRPCDRKSRR